VAQDMMGWEWHQLDNMQSICTLLQTDNHANTSPLSFLQARWPSCRPTNSGTALKEEMQSIDRQKHLMVLKLVNKLIHFITATSLHRKVK